MPTALERSYERTVRIGAPVDGLYEEMDSVHGLASLRLELEGAFDFTVSAQDETTLRYAATIRSTHPLLRRMPSSLTGALVEHVDTTTDLIAVRTRQYTQARRLLAEPE